MPEPVFKGNVFLHPDYQALTARYPELDVYTSAFKAYWLNGYHPLIGKDGILPVPDIYAQQAIGRAHVEPPVKSPKSYSSTDKCWLIWQGVIVGSEVEIVVPTSNTFLLYCVDYNRNSCLLGYLDGNTRHAHDVLKEHSFRGLMQLRAGSFYNRVPRSGPMPVEQHDSLFSESWMY